MIADTPAPAQASKEPLTIKDRLIWFALAAVLIGLAVSMWMWPDLGLLPDDVAGSGRGSRKLVGFIRIFEWIWSRPVGVILGLPGLLLLYATFAPAKKPAATT